MYSLLFLGGTSFFIALALTPLFRDLFLRLGIVDHPDDRKTHCKPIPRIGGIPIVVAILLSWGLLLVVPLNAGSSVRDNLPLVLRVIPAALIVFCVGLVDDLRSLRPWQKLVGEGAAAAAAVLGGVQIHALGGYAVSPWVGIPLTMLWLIACTNALNLIDGVDGLAAGVGFFAAITCLISALLRNNIPLALAIIPLAGALLGFLRYNFNPASVFLGDSGSLLIGFLLGCYGVLWTQKSATLLAVTAPLIALAIPLLDTGLSVVRRYLRLQPIFSPDRGHIHHRLLALGHSPRRVALLIYAVSGAFASLSLLLSVTRGGFAGVILVVFCAAAWLGVQHLGYVEFGTAGRMLAAGAFRRHLVAQLSLDSFAAALTAAATPDDCWEVITTYRKAFGFSEICLRYAGNYYDELCKENPPSGWQVQVPISDTDYLVLVRQFDTEAQSATVAPFVDAAARILRQNRARMAGSDQSMANLSTALSYRPVTEAELQ
ncbi:MAG: MraY family glycosyltransferase [Bryobacteraceae bacterium]